MSMDENQRLSVNRALKDILSSPGFKNSYQLGNFLSFVVDKTIAGKTTEIKGYTIGVDALGRPDDFDPQTDPSVRVMAGRLRQALENYYRHSSATSDSHSVEISLVKGSYIPQFKFNDGCDFHDGQNVSTELEIGKNGKTSIDANAHTHVNANIHDQTAFVSNPAAQRGYIQLSKMQVSVMGLAFLLLTSFVIYDFFTHHHSSAKSADATKLSQTNTRSTNDLLPSLSLYIEAEKASLPNWISPAKLESSALVAFSRFKDYRIFEYRGKDDLLFLGQMTSDYYLSVYFAKSGREDLIEAYLTLTRAQQNEVLWSETVEIQKPSNEVHGVNLSVIDTISANVMSPYGIIHSDFARQGEQETPTGRRNCIRLLYAYFSTENMENYTKASECAKDSLKNNNASSSLYAIQALLHVEAYKKQMAGSILSPLKNAMECARKAILLDPLNARAYQALSAVERSRGNHKAALTALQKAIMLNPNDRDISGDYAALKILTNNRSKGDTADAILAPASPVAPAWLAFAQYLQAELNGNFGKAAQIASNYTAYEAPLMAVAALLTADRNDDYNQLFLARQKLELLEPALINNPQDALIRRGLEEGYAKTLAIRIVKAVSNKHVTLK